MRKYQILISGKYLRSRVVNVLAVLGVTVGVSGLIIVYSVMSGFARDFQDRIRGIMSHVVVEGEQLVGIGDYERLIQRIETVPLVKACSPLVESPYVLIHVGKHTTFAQLRGVDLERERRISDIDAHLKRIRDDVQKKQAQLEEWRKEQDGKPAGDRTSGPEHWTGREWRELRLGRALQRTALTFDHENGLKPTGPAVLVGFQLAYQFDLQPGAPLSITSPTPLLTFEAKDFEVVGAFRCGLFEYDSQLVYVSLRDAQNLLGLPGRVTSISVALRDIRRLDQAKAAIQKAIRNETPIYEPARPGGAAPLQVTAGTTALKKTGAGTRLEIAPAGPDPAQRARVIIDHVATALKKADNPTTIAIDFHYPKSETRTPRPLFRVVLRDSSGTEFYCGEPKRGPARWTEPDQGGTRRWDLVNFASADGLDLLDPADIRQAVIDVSGGPILVSSLRFEDDRRVAVKSWRDKRANLLRAVGIERRILTVIMGVVVVIAGFGILAILWLMVKEKTRDIGILMSLGATRGGIVRIFLMNGAMIGLLGGGLGLAAGWTLSVKLNWIEDRIFELFGWRVFPSSIYYLDRMPHLESPMQFGLMALTAVVVSLLAAVWPAIRAARLNPIEALRYE